MCCCITGLPPATQQVSMPPGSSDNGAPGQQARLCWQRPPPAHAPGVPAPPAPPPGAASRLPSVPAQARACMDAVDEDVNKAGVHTHTTLIACPPTRRSNACPTMPLPAPTTCSCTRSVAAPRATVRIDRTSPSCCASVALPAAACSSATSAACCAAAPSPASCAAGWAAASPRCFCSKA